MESPDLLIFDCDGVLVDSEVLSCQCLVDVLAAHGLDIDLEQAFQRFLGRSSAAVIDYYLAAKGTPMPQEFRGEYLSHLATAFRGSLKLMPDVRAVLEATRQPYCLASSSDPDRIRMTLAVADLTSYFEGRIFSASMVEHSKPAPDLFLLAAAKMGAAQEKTIVIEDSVNGVLAGKAAGMTVWGFIGGSHYAKRDGRKLLGDAGADRVFDSMADFWPS